MSGAFETNVDLLAFSSLEEAQSNAIQLATLTAGIVIKIEGVAVGPHWITFEGLISREMAKDWFQAQYTELLSIISSNPPLPCTLSTTWKCILGYEENIFGYIVLNNFGKTTKTTTVVEWNDEIDDPSTVLCHINFERILYSLPSMQYGAHFCEICGNNIHKNRIIAVPGTRRCVTCQNI